MSRSTPSVSVIIPTYNRCAELSIAIESVKSQRLTGSEIIIVDDGSTDGTSDWIRENHPDVRLISQSNHGVSHARNRAIEIAKGDWIALLDSDDRWLPEKLAVQIAAIQNAPDIRLCHCDEIWIRNGKRVNPKFKHQKYGGEIFKHCLPLCAISPSAVMIHKTVFEQMGLFDESLPACEDYDLWLRICSQESVLYIDEQLLEKTGGHEDQLSQRYPAMDRFRLYALAKLIRTNSLTDEQRTQALNTFHEKMHIFCNGAKKRGNDDAVAAMLKDYKDLLSADDHYKLLR